MTESIKKESKLERNAKKKNRKEQHCSSNSHLTTENHLLEGEISIALQFKVIRTAAKESRHSSLFLPLGIHYQGY